MGYRTAPGISAPSGREVGCHRLYDPKMMSHGKPRSEIDLLGFGLWQGGQGKLCSSRHKEAKNHKDNIGRGWTPTL